MLLQQAEQFARHDSPELDDPAPPHRQPFVMGARVADQSIGIDKASGNPAENLDFFSAHDVGAVIGEIGYAGNDRLTLTYPDESVDDVVEPGRERT